MSSVSPWEPLTPAEVVDIFARLPSQPNWWFAGGYAIELFVQRAIRPHGDIDVLLLRRDQQVVHQLLPGWDVQAADPPGHLRPWPVGETLPDGVHDIWCREGASAPWRIQFMLDEANGDVWRSRRNPAVTLPLAQLGRRTADGWRYLAPQVQLFYKATAAALRPKDETDFAASLPQLSQSARRWLDQALSLQSPHHHWRDQLLHDLS